MLFFYENQKLNYFFKKVKKTKKGEFVRKKKEIKEIKT